MSTTTNAIVVASAETASAPSQTVATVGAGAGKGGFSATPTLGEIAEFQVTGLLVVFVVLGAITALSGFMSWLLKTLAPNQYYCKKPEDVAKAAAAPVAKAAPAATTSGLSQDKLLVLLAAAAQEVLGKSATVVSYKATDSSWALQGRVAHHHSHTH